LLNAISARVSTQPNVQSEQSEQVGDSKSPARPARILKILNAAIIDNVGRWAFSIDVGAVQNPRGPIPKTYIEMLKTTRHGQTFLWWAFLIGPPLVMKLPLRVVELLKNLAEHGKGVAEKLVSAREELGLHEMPEKQDMLDVLMKAPFAKTDPDMVRHQAAHMIAGATETSAGTMGWALHLMANHPDVQERVRREVRQKLPSPAPLGTATTLREADFSECEYLECVVKEVLRYHSLNTILWREAIEPAEIAGIQIPKGTQVYFSP
jgi:hypothetical protein